MRENRAQNMPLGTWKDLPSTRERAREGDSTNKEHQETDRQTDRYHQKHQLLPSRVLKEREGESITSRERALIGESSRERGKAEVGHGAFIRGTGRKPEHLQG